MQSGIGTWIIVVIVWLPLIGWFLNLGKLISYAAKGGSGGIITVRILGLIVFPIGVFLGYFIGNPKPPPIEHYRDY